jgi:hypothetical protein
VVHWRALLIVYPELHVRLSNSRWLKRRYRHHATEQEIIDATESFDAFPQLVSDLTSSAVRVDQKTVVTHSLLRSLTKQNGKFYWPSPDDTRTELDNLAPLGSYESIFVFWPQHDSVKQSSILCRGWGLGMGPSGWSNGATYAVVANAPTRTWKREAPGEVWLHEWLHGVCEFFRSRGFAMPERDADGAEVHGYVRSATVGWTEYYRDLMNGNVLENGKLLGISPALWRGDTIHTT